MWNRNKGCLLLLIITMDLNVCKEVYVTSLNTVKWMNNWCFYSLRLNIPAPFLWECIAWIQPFKRIEWIQPLKCIEWTEPLRCLTIVQKGEITTSFYNCAESVQLHNNIRRLTLLSIAHLFRKTVNSERTLSVNYNSRTFIGSVVEKMCFCVRVHV